MKTLKGSDIANNLGISNATVSGWIADAKTGQNSLEIESGRIVDSFRNQEEMQRLYEKGRGHLKKIYKEDILAPKKFLTLFDSDQLIEFVSDLEKGEINEKFSYLDKEGAENWNAIYESEASNLQSNSYFLLKNLFNWISPYLSNQSKYNVFDVGPGNALPILDFLQPLMKDKKLDKYFALDISKDINEVAKKNIEKLLPNVFGEAIIADIEHTRFGKYFYENLSEKTSNLIFFIGGTISNIIDRPRVFKNIQSGMTSGDFLVFTFSLDTDENRKGLSYVLNKESDRHQNWLPEFLGIEIDPTKNNAVYNHEGNYKYKTFTVDKDYNITFPIFKQNKTVFLKKGSEIKTWRHYLINFGQVEKELNQAGLEIVVFNKDLTRQTGMMICKVS